MSFEIFVFVKPQASVETNTNQSESTEYRLSSSKRAVGSKFVSFGLFVFVKITSSSWLKSSNLLSTKFVTTMTPEQKHSVIQAILTFISSILCAITASSCIL